MVTEVDPNRLLVLPAARGATDGGSCDRRTDRSSTASEEVFEQFRPTSDGALDSEGDTAESAGGPHARVDATGRACTRTWQRVERCQTHRALLARWDQGFSRPLPAPLPMDRLSSRCWFDGGRSDAGGTNAQTALPNAAAWVRLERSCAGVNVKHHDFTPGGSDKTDISRV